MEEVDGRKFMLQVITKYLTYTTFEEVVMFRTNTDIMRFG
jgi:hypothetical protein